MSDVPSPARDGLLGAVPWAFTPISIASISSLSRITPFATTPAQPFRSTIFSHSVAEQSERPTSGAVDDQYLIMRRVIGHPLDYIHPGVVAHSVNEPGERWTTPEAHELELARLDICTRIAQITRTQVHSDFTWLQAGRFRAAGNNAAIELLN